MYRVYPHAPDIYGVIRILCDWAATVGAFLNCDRAENTAIHRMVTSGDVETILGRRHPGKRSGE